MAEGERSAGEGDQRVRHLAERGDLHAHTDWSDGHHSLAKLIEAAEARGYEYILVSDHSKSSTVAGGLGSDRLRE